MKINRLTASFGKLENQTLSFHDGLNVIYAPNESGKSTWCAFIRAMLYGIDSSERARTGHIPDKTRYAPWSGAPMEGSMELTTDGCDITVTRRSASAAAPMRLFSATYTGTSEPVRELNGTNAGELLTGVTRDVFRRSAFIEQGSVTVTDSPELEKRITAIVSTGEDSFSYSEIDGRLRAWQRRRSYNRKGLIPETEEAIAQTKEKIAAMEGAAQEAAALEAELEENRSRCESLEQLVSESRKTQRRDSLVRLNEGRKACREAEKIHQEAMSEFSARKDELRESRFAGRKPDELGDELDADLDELKALKETGERRVSLLPGILAFVLAAVLAFLYTVYDSIPLLIAAAAAGIAALFLLIRLNAKKRASDEAAERRKELLKKYGAGSVAEIKDMYRSYLALYRAAVRAAEREERAAAEYEEARAKQEEYEQQALEELDFSSGNSEAAALGRQLAKARENVSGLAGELSALRGRMELMGDPMVLKTELADLEARLVQLQADNAAIGLAAEMLKDADTELGLRFSPALGKLAGEYMSVMTDGKYSKILIDRDFSARTQTAEDAVARDSGYLSAGTLDLMYLAVRLAVCELALPDGESCPLIIDDALVNLDAGRRAQVMTLLKEIARSRQVILFSCRE